MNPTHLNQFKIVRGTGAFILDERGARPVNEITREMLYRESAELFALLQSYEYSYGKARRERKHRNPDKIALFKCAMQIVENKILKLVARLKHRARPPHR